MRFIALFIFVVGVIAGLAVLDKSTETTVEAKVIKTENTLHGNSDHLESKYMVYTTTEVFENSDTMLYMKFNSSDVYSQIEAGHTYRFRVYGWRIPFLSMYRNIISAELVKTW